MKLLMNTDFNRKLCNWFWGIRNMNQKYVLPHFEELEEEIKAAAYDKT
ncbi:MAG: hypothetical protein VX696_03865 [Pseudomonadota bacterium]|nr:hypothetical protein [Pseudomonadota bacterium]